MLNQDYKLYDFKNHHSFQSGILQKLLSHRSTLQDVMTQVCELVQRDAFTQSMYVLGLLDSANQGHTTDCQRTSKVPVNTTPKQHSYKLNLVESLCISPSATNSALSQFSLKLLKSGFRTDMVFEVVNSTNGEHAEGSEVEEQCVIRAHRVIVAARCDWFRRALLSGMREAIDRYVEFRNDYFYIITVTFRRKITIHDSNPFLFRTFLEYLYSGQLRHQSLGSEQLAELLLLADRYEVDQLKQACEYTLRSMIDEENVLYMLGMSDQFNAGLLRVRIGWFVLIIEYENFYETVYVHFFSKVDKIGAV